MLINCSCSDAAGIQAMLNNNLYINFGIKMIW